MSLYNDRQQGNPEDDSPFVGELKAKVDALAKALDQNTGPIQRWFWKALLAFNLVLWSVVLAVKFLLR